MKQHNDRGGLLDIVASRNDLLTPTVDVVDRPSSAALVGDVELSSADLPCNDRPSVPTT